MMHTCASVRSTSSEDRPGGSGACVLQLRQGENSVALVVLNGITVVNLPKPVEFDNAQLFVSTTAPTPTTGRGTVLSYAHVGAVGKSTPLVEKPVPSRFNREEPL